MRIVKEPKPGVYILEHAQWRGGTFKYLSFYGDYTWKRPLNWVDREGTEPGFWLRRKLDHLAVQCLEEKEAADERATRIAALFGDS